MASGSELSEHLRAVADKARPLEAAHALESLRAKLCDAGDTISVGRFELKAHLGTGGMGTVMAAFDPQLQRTVALKVLHASDDPEEHARLLGEARTMAKVRHPNLVSVYEVGSHEGAVYIAMEFVEGGSLRRWLETPRSWGAVVEVFLGAARGLGALHDAGLVHRDFKPDNVLLNDDGRAQVSDFGLALAQPGEQAHADEDLQATSHSGRQDTSPSTEGTPGYIAPEQWIGARADAASDQWSFCVALYEALHGARPYRAKSSYALRAAVLEGTRAPLPEDRPRIPGWLRKIVDRGLSRRPEERFTSMEALHDALLRGVKRHRARPRRVALFAGVGAAAMLGMFARPSAAPCEGEDTALTNAWTAEHRAALAARFDQASGREAWAVLEPLLDDRVQAWKLQRRDACEATRVHGTQSEEALDLRMQCLERRADELEALLTTYDEVTAQSIGHTLAGFDRLPPPEVCEDLALLQAVEPLPDAPEARATVEALRERVTSRNARLTAGDMDEDPLTALVKDAEAVGYDPVIAEALLLLAKRTSIAGEAKRAADLYERAFDHALAGQHLEVQQWAASTLVFVVGAGLHDHDAASRWAAHARALLRAHPQPNVEAALEQNLGTLALREQDWKAARAHLERARALQTDLPGTGANRLQLQASLAVLAREEERYDDAVSLFEATLAETERLHGPEHPRISSLTSSLAHTRLAQRELEEAERLYRKAVAIIEAREGTDAKSLGHPLNALAWVSIERGRYADALPILDRVIALWSAKDPDDPFLATPYRNRAEALLGLERYAEAREAAARAEALEPKTAPPSARATRLMLQARAVAPEDPERAQALARSAMALELDAQTREKLTAWQATLPR